MLNFCVFSKSDSLCPEQEHWKFYVNIIILLTQNLSFSLKKNYRNSSSRFVDEDQIPVFFGYLWRVDEGGLDFQRGFSENRDTEKYRFSSVYPDTSNRPWKSQKLWWCSVIFVLWCERASLSDSVFQEAGIQKFIQYSVTVTYIYYDSKSKTK